MDGLKIGDVGHVTSDGVFRVCCNINCKPDAEINSRVPDFRDIELDKTDIEINPHAIPSPMVIKSKCITEDDCDDLSAPRVFRSKISSGAILILPSGARFENLQDSAIEKFRKIAEKHGHEWCMTTPPACKLVILITGLYKARSWSLGYFNDPPEKITATPQNARPLVPPQKYTWKADNATIFPGGHSEESALNQTVFLRGFWVTEKDVPAEKDRSCLSMLWVFLNWLRRSRAVEIQHKPMLTHPCDISDELSRRLLEKIPAAKIAIIHDNDWTHMLDEESCEALVQVDRILETLQDSGLVSMNNHGVVSLGSKISHPSPAKPVSFLTMTVIKSLRVGNAFSSLKRIPFGFYIQLNDGERRTTTKFALVNSPTIEWIEELPLPDSSEKVRLSLCVMFGSDPILSGREVLHTIEIDIQDLSGTTYHMIEFPSGEQESSASQLFLTLGERPGGYLKARSDYDIGRSCRELSPYVSETTRVKISPKPVEHFESALNDLTREGHGYATAVFNLATAQLNSYLLDGTCSDIYRSVHHPLPGSARVASSRNLALQTFKRHKLARSSKFEGLDELLEELDMAVRDCPEGYFDKPHRLINLGIALQMRSQYCDNLGDLSCISKSVRVHEEALRLIPPRHPDKATFLISLKTALLTRFEQRKDSRDFSDLNRSIEIIAEAERLVPEGHVERAACLHAFSVALLRRFEQITDPTDLTDLNRSIQLGDEASQLIKSAHPDKATYLRSLSAALLKRFDLRGALTDIDRHITVLEEILQLVQSLQSDRVVYLHSLGVALLRRFNLRADSTDLTDVNRSISLNDEALQLVPMESPNRVPYLNSLSVALLKRFDISDLTNFTDLDDHVATLKEILRLIPSDHPSRTTYLSSLDSAIQRRPKAEQSNKEPVTRAETPATHTGEPVTHTQSPRSKFPDQGEIDVLVVGQTGVGKSTIINMIRRVADTSEAAAKVSGSAFPCTKQTTAYPMELEPGLICQLWDTRGLDGTVESRDRGFMAKIVNQLRQMEKQQERELRETIRHRTRVATPILMWCIDATKPRSPVPLATVSKGIRGVLRSKGDTGDRDHPDDLKRTEWEQVCRSQLQQLDLGLDVPLLRTWESATA
ncbi:hypothetical protein JVU11DRAFT_7326 [Chiua virens]|nr:hypothetical protein JVU11DRAFT_7326 [Chiua virens]